MADVSGITAIRETDSTTSQLVDCGATVALGSPLYIDTSDNEYKLSDADSGTASNTVRGVAINTGVDGGSVRVATSGSIVLVGATLAVGTAYYLSDTAGGIKPAGDLTTGDNVVLIGVASTTTQLDLKIHDFGITHA